MNADILVRYLHFASILLLVSVVFTQHLLLKKTMTRGELLRVHRLDLVYGISAIGVLATGLIQWFGANIGKPAEFYTKNPVFHGKVTLFLLVGIISIFPTVFLFKKRAGDPGDGIAVPKSILMAVRLELLLLFLIPLFAALMARGVGLPMGE